MHQERHEHLRRRQRAVPADQDARYGKEQAEAVLLERGYTYPTIGPTPDGWSGYALVHGLQMNLTVGKNGIVTFKP